MIADTLLLAELRLRLIWNGWTARRRWHQILFAVGTLWIAGAIGTLAALFGFGVGSLLARFADNSFAPLVPAFVLTAVALILLFSSFGLALGSLYLANDLELLMSAPVDRRAVFLVKLLDGLGMEYAITGFTALPALTAFGIGQGYDPAYFVLMVAALGSAPLLPAGLGAVLVMLVARIAPARRVRDMLAIAGALTGIGLGLIGQTTRLWTGQFDAVTDDPRAVLAPLLDVLAWPAPTFLGGRGLAAAGVGDGATAAGLLAAYFALTAGLFAGCVWLAGSLYGAGWVRLQSGGVARRRAPAAPRSGRRTAWTNRLPVPLAIAAKDWRLIRRDLRYTVQLIAPLIFLPIVYFNVVTGGGARGGGALRAVERWAGDATDPAGVFIAAGVLVTSVMFFAQIAATGISLEGAAWWLIRAAPVSPHEVLLGKLLTTWLPFIVLSTLAFAAAAWWRGFSPAGALYGWFGIQALGGGMLALATGLAVPWARLDWENPKQMNSTWGVLIAYAGIFLLGLLGGGLLCLPWLAAVLAPALHGAALVTGLFGVAAVSLITALLAFQLGIRRLPSIGET